MTKLISRDLEVTEIEKGDLFFNFNLVDVATMSIFNLSTSSSNPEMDKIKVGDFVRVTLHKLDPYDKGN